MRVDVPIELPVDVPIDPLPCTSKGYALGCACVYSQASALPSESRHSPSHSLDLQQALQQVLQKVVHVYID